VQKEEIVSDIYDFIQKNYRMRSNVEGVCVEIIIEISKKHSFQATLLFFFQ